MIHFTSAMQFTPTWKCMSKFIHPESMYEHYQFTLFWKWKWYVFLNYTFVNRNQMFLKVMLASYKSHYTTKSTWTPDQHCHMWVLLPNCCHKVWRTQSSRIYLHFIALKLRDLAQTCSTMALQNLKERFPRRVEVMIAKTKLGFSTSTWVCLVRCPHTFGILLHLFAVHSSNF